MIPTHLASFSWYAGHQQWCRETYGYCRHEPPEGTAAVRADLQDAELQGANLWGANLRGANIQRSNLRRATLWGANLQGADLQGANLQCANLQCANLKGSDLWGAGLQEANLRCAILQGADLQGANLQCADLHGAYLPAPTMILLAYWGTVSDDLCADLMRYDAACHPDPEAFSRWAAGGACPYDDVRVERAAHFRERRDLYIPGPCPRPYDLMNRVLAECCPDWTPERVAEFEARRAPTTETT